MAGPTPRDGDIVVARDSKPATRYTVRQLPGDAQFSASHRDEAVRLARGFAQEQAVDLWYSENGINHLLEVYRAKATIPGGAAQTAQED